MSGSRRGGCGCGGCAVLLVVLLVLVLVWAAIVPFRLLQRVGLQQSAAERLLRGPPDREAAQILTQRLKAAGTDMSGVTVQVMELGATGERVAFATVDLSKTEGLGPSDTGDAQDTLTGIADLTEGLDIDRIAVFFANEQGTPLFTITHQVKAIQALEKGTLSETEFLKGLGVDVDWAILREVLR